MNSTPFSYSASDADIADLKDRIARTRWPLTSAPDWSTGVPPAYLRDLSRYWLDEYNWRAHEAVHNSFPQYTTKVDGATIHYVHCRSSDPDAIPIILTHGWPGSFIDYLSVVSHLTHTPNDPDLHATPNFHVIIPSIPGYGFSTIDDYGRWDVDRVSAAWGDLMDELGYTRYIVHGGDWGKVISLSLARQRPDNVLGVHLSMLSTFADPDDTDLLASLTSVDQERIHRAATFLGTGMGWQKIQSTRPTTLSYGLTDSPVGQLAWITEKFYEWTGAKEAPEEAVPRDAILSTATLYWLTKSAGTSAALYHATTPDDSAMAATWGGPWPLPQPVGVAVLPDDATPPVRALADRLLPSLAQWTEFKTGGHFPGLEQPSNLAADIRVFARNEVLEGT